MADATARLAQWHLTVYLFPEKFIYFPKSPEVVPVFQELSQYLMREVTSASAGRVARPLRAVSSMMKLI